MNDEFYMRQALSLAAKGAGWVNPNPQVGCVIVRDDSIIGKGYHHEYGNLHAEREALRSCTVSPEGATAYVTLEPCCHQGKQPPCTEALLQAGISRVVIGSPDPNPLVAGKGIEILRSANIQVDTFLLRAECDELNREWLYYIANKRPYVTMKYAMTLDGKIATYCGESKWITGSQARARVHEDRHKASGIMVGVGTILADDPSLTARREGMASKDPLRVICDSTLRIPLDCQVVLTAEEVPTVVACLENADKHKIAELESRGVRVICLPEDEGVVSLPPLMEELGQAGVHHLIVEGGATLHWSLMRSGCLNRVQAYVAAKLFGGSDAPSPIGGLGVTHPDQALLLSNPTVTELGDDLLIECEVPACSQA